MSRTYTSGPLFVSSWGASGAVVVKLTYCPFSLIEGSSASHGVVASDGPLAHDSEPSILPTATGCTSPVSRLRRQTPLSPPKEPSKATYARCRRSLGRARTGSAAGVLRRTLGSRPTPARSARTRRPRPKRARPGAPRRLAPRRSAPSRGPGTPARRSGERGGSCCSSHAHQPADDGAVAGVVDDVRHDRVDPGVGVAVAEQLVAVSAPAVAEADADGSCVDAGGVVADPHAPLRRRDVHGERRRSAARRPRAGWPRGVSVASP